jgi:hypothetical protein
MFLLVFILSALLVCAGGVIWGLYNKCRSLAEENKLLVGTISMYIQCFNKLREENKKLRVKLLDAIRDLSNHEVDYFKAITENIILRAAQNAYGLS